jgi:hypothetical protein
MAGPIFFYELISLIKIVSEVDSFSFPGDSRGKATDQAGLDLVQKEAR